MVDILLKSGAVPTYPDRQGGTPLHWVHDNGILEHL